MSRKHKKADLYSLCFILGFILMLLFPIYGGILDPYIILSGVSTEAALKPPTYESIMDGSYQSSLNTWVENNFPGRKLLIKARSQLMFSLLNESPNEHVIIGAENQLFEPQYIYYELGIHSTQEQKIQETIDKLEDLQDLLNEQGKELYLFITPSKAHFNNEYIPSYFKLAKQPGENDYQKFSRLLKDSSLCYFDSPAYIENYSGDDIEAPVFYSTGIHWSQPWGYSSVKAFWELMDAHSRWNLSKLSLSIFPSDVPIDPGTDLYDSLNLLEDPTGIQYYDASLSIAELGDKPNVFFRGGSFIAQSVSGLINAGVINQDTYFENHRYYMDQYSSTGTISSLSAYDEMPVLAERLSNADILVLEVNEDKVYDPSFGFVDYLLEHPEFLNYPQQEA